MSYLNLKDKIIASLMALSAVGLLGAFCAQMVLGAKRAFAEPAAAVAFTKSSSFLPEVGSLGALVLGSICLALTRRILRG